MSADEVSNHIRNMDKYERQAFDESIGQVERDYPDTTFTEKLELSVFSSIVGKKHNDDILKTCGIIGILAVVIGIAKMIGW